MEACAWNPRCRFMTLRIESVDPHERAPSTGPLGDKAAFHYRVGKDLQD